jgi:phosphoribulokinase
MDRQNYRSQLSQDNSNNIAQKANILGLQLEAQDKDRQLKDYMYDQYMADIERRKAKEREVKQAQHDAENRRIAEQEAKFVKTDRAARLKKSKFLQELDEATEYQKYLKQAEKDKVKADHEGWLRYCHQLDD